MGGMKGNFVYIIYVPDFHSKWEKLETSARQINIPDFHNELEKRGNNLAPLSSNSKLVVSLHFMFIEMASVAGKVVQ